MILDLTAPMKGRDLEEYGAARIRNDAFEQVRLLWERRKEEGWTQKRIAEEIGRDPAWVSRNLSAPGNWTLRTIGAFTQALSGEVEIRIVALEDTVDTPSNFDAYDGYTIADTDTRNVGGHLISVVDVTNFIKTYFDAPQKAIQLNLEFVR